MPINKNAQIRYQILDRCFSDFGRKYEIDDLMDAVNRRLYDLMGDNVCLRQLREDINNMKLRPYCAPIKAFRYYGKRFYYRYTDPNFSIFKNELSTQEVDNLRSTIEMLGRYRGIPANAWLEEVISNLEYRFGVKANAENVVAFEQNEQLKGLEFLSELIDAAVNHQPLSIFYRSYRGIEHDTIVHPYYIKQYNNRWFLLGLEQTEKGNRLTNKALDRIVKLSKVDVPFIPNKDIDFSLYFKDIIGVTVPKDHPVAEKVVLKFDEERLPYIVSKPIHPSQEIISQDENIIQITVRPNKELEAQILSYGPQVEVLEPLWLRKQIEEKISKTLMKYSSV